MTSPRPDTHDDPAVSQSAERPEKTCACGHDIDHHMVSAVRCYSIWGWIRFFMGITAVPTRIRYTCRRCDQVIAVTSDPAVMRARTYR